jgi:hypothetical protein
MDAKLLVGWTTKKIDVNFLGYKGPMAKKCKLMTYCFKWLPDG